MPKQYRTTLAAALPRTPNRIFLAPHERDDVPNNQEVIGEAGLSHHFQFVFHADAGGFVVVAVALVESLPAQPFQVGVGILVIGGRVARQMHLAETQRKRCTAGRFLP